VVQIVSWNIQWGRGVDGRVDLDRIVTHAKRFADFDVLCLQEVSSAYPELAGCDGHDQFDAIAKLLPGYTAIPGVATDTPADSETPTQRRRFGNMILSRLPVQQVFRHLLPWPADPAVPSMQRIALEANVRTPAGRLRVTTTHLEYYSAVQRAAQVERLRALHQEAVAQARCIHPGRREDGPFEHMPRAQASVLCGDFNMPPDDPLMPRLQQAYDDDIPGYVDAWQLAHPGKPHLPTLGLYDRQQWPHGPATFDFFLVSEDLAPRVRQVRVDDASDASDHQPILLELA
jgi:endonuclease/exonuclease/phosphatase family metal-dependent hydrolase